MPAAHEWAQASASRFFARERPLWRETDLLIELEVSAADLSARCEERRLKTQGHDPTNGLEFSIGKCALLLATIADRHGVQALDLMSRAIADIKRDRDMLPLVPAPKLHGKPLM